MIIDEKTRLSTLLSDSQYGIFSQLNWIGSDPLQIIN